MKLSAHHPPAIQFDLVVCAAGASSADPMQYKGRSLRRRSSLTPALLLLLLLQYKEQPLLRRLRPPTRRRSSPPLRLGAAETASPPH